MPFDADQDRWTHVVRAAARFRDASHTELAAPEALAIRERTRGGWLRWGAFAGRSHPASVLREAGVLDPAQRRVGRWACRTVWGLAPPLYIWTVGGFLLPRPLPVGRTAVFAVVAAAALGPASSLLPAGFGLLGAVAVGLAVSSGLPAAVRRLTRRRVRVVGGDEPYGPVFFRLLAAEQRLRILAERSERPELARAAAVLPRLLWDAAGLVPVAADDPEARELLCGYAQSLGLLADQAAEVEQQEEAVEAAIRDERASVVPARAALPEGLLPRALLEEARLELEELGQGLRHARELLDGAPEGGHRHARSGETDE
ncbi:hypothetical protein [Streptomyces sp. NPDC050485]|uniref:hypothetical protein n=1 Tax=Streptomyces sp. NPDC050485 TaxID=3365617 RepID=UPI00379A7B24